MSYNSHRPLASYSFLELVARSLASLLYYGWYLAIYLCWFLPRSWLVRRLPAPEFDLYAKHYYTRPEFAYFKADEGLCFRSRMGTLPAPSLEIGYEDGRLSSYHTGNHVFDLGLEYDAAVVGKSPLFPHYRRIVSGSFDRMPLGSGSLGSVVAIHVLDHVADLDAALAETARVLRPGGEFLFSLFSVRAPAVLGHRRLASQNLYNFLERPAWEQSLAKHGFELIIYREFTFSPIFLRIYFLGLRGLIPHDRSLLFRLLDDYAPLLGRGLRAGLIHMTKTIYRPVYDHAPVSARGCNCFLVARRRRLA